MNELILLILAALPAPAFQKGTAVEMDNPYQAFDGAQSYADILEKQATLEWLALPPKPGEGTRFFRGQAQVAKVIAEGVGSGYVASIWAENGATGNLEFFIDGASSPSWTVSFEQLFAGPLAKSNKEGTRCTLPVTFAKSIQVKTTAADFAYLLEVTRLGEGVTVPSFSGELLTANLEAIQNLENTLLNNAQAPAGRIVKGWGAATPVAPYEYFIVGNGVVTWFELAFMNPIPVHLQEQVLRQLRLEITQGTTLEGGRDNPDVLVNAPFGDFFGTAPGLHGFQDRAFGVSPGGAVYCRLPMPYKDGLRIRIANDGENDYRFSLRLSLRQMMEPPQTRLRAVYHQGKWSSASFVAAKEIPGPGRLVGASISTLNPGKEWWGQGESLVTADGTETQAQGGPGVGAFFDAASFVTGPFEFGWHHFNRFFTESSVTFHRELSLSHGLGDSAYADMEIATMVWWYGPTHRQIPPALPALADRIPSALPQPDFPLVLGATEGESMTVVRATGGRAAPIQGELAGIADLNAGAALLWQGAEAGNMLILSFPISLASQAEIRARFLTGPGSPSVQVYLNGRPIGDSISLAATQLGTQSFSLGIHELTARDHRLTLKVDGAGPVGLDYLEFVPVPTTD